MNLNVVYSSDDNYSKYLGISLLSLLINNCKDFKKVNVYIINNNISEENINNIMSISSNYKNVNIEFIEFNNIAKNLKTDNRFSISSFGRIFISNFIKDDYVIYLDCDSIVYGSFKELVKLDINDYYLAGVLDNVHYFYKTSIGLEKNDYYINAGFLYVNLKKWREDKLEEKAIEFINKYNGSVPHHDQGVINAICHNKIKIIHPKYNLQCPMFNYSSEQIKKLEQIDYYYTDEELTEAKKNPVFIHYTNDFFNRPWNKDCTHPLKNIYIDYMNQSPWKGQLENNHLCRNAIIMRNLYKFLPFWLYYRINNFIAKKKEKRYKKIWKN